jgi:hypothetical protein
VYLRLLHKVADDKFKDKWGCEVWEERLLTETNKAFEEAAAKT